MNEIEAPRGAERYRMESAALEYAVHRPELVAKSAVRSGCLLDPVLREAFAALEQAATLDQALAAVGPDAEMALLRAIEWTCGFTPWVIIKQALEAR